MRLVIGLVLVALIVAVAASLASAQESSGASANARQSSDDIDNTPLKAQLLEDHAPVKGRLLDVTPETIALLVKGKRVEIPMKDVTAVDVGGDPVSDGAAIGAVVMGTICALSICRFSETPGEFITAMVFEAGFGALIGAGMDAMHTSPTTVFRKDVGRQARLRPAIAVRWRF